MGGPSGIYVVTKPQSSSLASLDVDQLMSKVDWNLQVLMGEVWARPKNVMCPFDPHAIYWNSVISKRVGKMRKAK